MAIGSVNLNKLPNVYAVNFKGDADAAKATSEKTTISPAKTTTAPAIEKTDELVKTSSQKVETPRKSGLLRKIGTGVLSVLWPGLGQFANGQWLKAVGFAVGVPLIITAGFFIGGYLGLGIMAGAYLWNVIDAVKNA